MSLIFKSLVKENLSHVPFTLPRKTCQGKTCKGKLASVYSRQVFLDKRGCQGNLASVNEALSISSTDLSIGCVPNIRSVVLIYRSVVSEIFVTATRSVVSNP